MSVPFLFEGDRVVSDYIGWKFASHCGILRGTQGDRRGRGCGEREHNAIMKMVDCDQTMLDICATGTRFGRVSALADIADLLGKPRSGGSLPLSESCLSSWLDTCISSLPAGYAMGFPLLLRNLVPTHRQLARDARKDTAATLFAWSLCAVQTRSSVFEVLSGESICRRSAIHIA